MRSVICRCAHPRSKGCIRWRAFAAAGLAAWLGIRARLAHVANLAAAFFVILLYLRFFHWWWDWMPGYLFFLIIGLISIGLLALFRKLRMRAAEAARP